MKLKEPPYKGTAGRKTPAYIRRKQALYQNDVEAALKMPATSPVKRHAQFEQLEALKRRNAELCEAYGAADHAHQPAEAPQPPTVLRVDRRPRERREQQHTARSTSSGDSGDSDVA